MKLNQSALGALNKINNPTLIVLYSGVQPSVNTYITNFSADYSSNGANILQIYNLGGSAGYSSYEYVGTNTDVSGSDASSTDVGGPDAGGVGIIDASTDVGGSTGDVSVGASIDAAADASTDVGGSTGDAAATDAGTDVGSSTGDSSVGSTTGVEHYQGGPFLTSSEVYNGISYRKATGPNTNFPKQSIRSGTSTWAAFFYDISDLSNINSITNNNQFIIVPVSNLSGLGILKLRNTTVTYSSASSDNLIADCIIDVRLPESQVPTTQAPTTTAAPGGDSSVGTGATDSSVGASTDVGGNTGDSSVGASTDVGGNTGDAAADASTDVGGTTGDAAADASTGDADAGGAGGDGWGAADGGGGGDGA